MTYLPETPMYLVGQLDAQTSMLMRSEVATLTQSGKPAGELTHPKNVKSPTVAGRLGSVVVLLNWAAAKLAAPTAAASA